LGAVAQNGGYAIFFSQFAFSPPSHCFTEHELKNLNVRSKNQKLLTDFNPNPIRHVTYFADIKERPN
jgi:hypothetical protein